MKRTAGECRNFGLYNNNNKNFSQTTFIWLGEIGTSVVFFKDTVLSRIASFRIGETR